MQREECPKCPECNTEIDHLKISITQEFVEFRCPNCKSRLLLTDGCTSQPEENIKFVKQFGIEIG